MRNASSRWAYTEAGIVLEDDAAEGLERVWVNPALAGLLGRARFGLRVDILGRFEDLGSLDAVLLVLGDFFARDSMLAAIVARGSATRIVFYTATWEAIVWERYDAVCAVLGGLPIGLHVEVDPSWEVLAEIRALAGGWDAHQPSSSERCG